MRIFEINNICRKNILAMTPYSSARSEYKGEGAVFLDANENSSCRQINGYTGSLNRYPDPLQLALKKKISELRKIPSENIFVGNGSDEAIDILFRIFCVPSQSNVIICPPTYGMYEVAASVNNVEVIKVPLLEDSFALDLAGVLKAIGSDTRMILLCSPNNPTGNLIAWNETEKLLNSFSGLVIVDEAYIDFSNSTGHLDKLKEHANLVILQTLSKAWGLAALRIGLAFASTEIIGLFNKIKSPYNISSVSQDLALKALINAEQVLAEVKEIVMERELMASELNTLSFVRKVYKSEGNFVLVKLKDPLRVYDYLLNNGIVIRDRSRIKMCEGCLRFTIGTKEENRKVLELLKKMQ